MGLRRLLPDPAPTTVRAQLERFRPRELAGDERPYVFTNFAVTVDGHATIGGVSGKIAGETDTEILMSLRGLADAVMVGAGTIAGEEYGRLLPGRERREPRELAGLAPDPLAVVVSNRFELPWGIGLFESGAGRVLVLTASDREPPATATPVEVWRYEGGVDLPAALARLRSETGVRALLCEGGPHLHGDLLGAGLVDELFVTVGPKLAGGGGPRLAEGLEGEPVALELRWLLQREGELYARYAIRG